MNLKRFAYMSIFFLLSVKNYIKFQNEIILNQKVNFSWTISKQSVWNFKNFFLEKVVFLNLLNSPVSYLMLLFGLISTLQ